VVARRASTCSGGPLLQRTVDGIGDLPGLKSNKRAWNAFLLLDKARQPNFQADVADAKDVPLQPYVDEALLSGRTVVENWFVANIAAIASNPPDRIEVGLQDVADYQYDKLLRFYWFGLTGPMGRAARERRPTCSCSGSTCTAGPGTPGWDMPGARWATSPGTRSRSSSCTA
jgi:hypothetical protein